MYKVLLDNALMCDSRIEELALINPIVNLEENKAGSFSFTITPEHPKYDAIQHRKSVLQVYKDEELIFSGICIEADTDFYKRKEVYCEGELTYLNDSIQRPARYQGITVRGLLEAFIANHNAQVEEQKQFQVGMVTVEDANDYLYCYTNMESTMECLKEDLQEDLGGFFRVRHENGVKYIDYLADSINTNSQDIRLGENLLDFNSNIDSSDIATAVIPLGATLEEESVNGLQAKLTIELVNDGKDFVFNQAAVDNFGWIYKTVSYPDVTVASNLKAKGEKYLADTQFENIVIEAKAIDMHMVDESIESLKLSDRIRVVSKPHGMDRYFRLTKRPYHLNNPEIDTITLGKTEVVGIVAQTNSANKQASLAIEQAVSEGNNAYKQAVENATALITSAMGGYVYKTNSELFIMDTDDPETAKKVWRWNINGLGYSSTGINGEYSIAMTMDGKFVADFILAGALSADRIKGGSISASSFDIKGTVTKYASDYTEEDRYRANAITIGLIEPTEEDYEKLDLTGDGIINMQDVMMISRFLQTDLESVTFDTSIRINSGDEKEIIKLQDVSIGATSVRAKSINATSQIFAKEYRAYDAETGFWDAGDSGTFTTADGKTVTVLSGLITHISDV